MPPEPPPSRRPSSFFLSRRRGQSPRGSTSGEASIHRSYSLPPPSALPPAPNENKAATAVQRRFRGFQVRKSQSGPAAMSADEQKAATTLQAAARGRATRGKSSSASSISSTKSESTKAATPEPSTGRSVKARAATNVQKRYRGFQVRKDKLLSGGVLNAAGNAMTGMVESINEKGLAVKFGITIKAVEKGVSLGIRTAIATDPWIPPKLADVIEPVLLSSISEITSRALHAEIELAGKGSAALRELLQKQQKAETWPPPPPPTRPFRWLRARFLYAVNSADRNMSYKTFKEPWMLGVMLVMYAPPIFPFFGLSVLLWIWYWICIIPCEDEFTLFNFIASFKTYSFIMCGIFPIFTDFYKFYFTLSDVDFLRQHIDEKTAAVSTGWIDYAEMCCNRAFTVVVALCWVTFLRYKAVRKMHYGAGVGFWKAAITTETKGGGVGTRMLEEGSDDLESGAEAPTSRWARVHEDPDNVYAAIHTGDQDTGDREQELLMTWDVTIFVLHWIFGVLDLVLRQKGNPVTSLLVPTWRTMLFERFLVISLSIFAAPFVLWKLPGLGELIHQFRPTGFDASGKLRISMSLAGMKKKWNEEQALDEKSERKAKKPPKEQAASSSKAAAKTASGKAAAGVHKEKKTML